MALKDFQAHAVELLQRSLERGRLAHAYVFTGHHQEQLEAVARSLAKTINCQRPVMRAGATVDCCDECSSCFKIEHENHADVLWIRPESKMRLIKIGQIVRRDDSPPRVIREFVNLKPTEGNYKICVIVAADRMNDQAANAFLKTLEEPPANSILILLTTNRQRLLETILSRCLRLDFGGEATRQLGKGQMAWLATFSTMAAEEQKSLLGRYRLMDLLLGKLAELKSNIETALKARSPLERYEDAEKDLREKWEDELSAAIEAEYRQQRADLLLVVQWWLRDVWLQTMGGRASGNGKTGLNSEGSAAGADGGLLNFPALAATAQLARRISPPQATENLRVVDQLQRWLNTNAQEALALEVGMLKLHL